MADVFNVDERKSIYAKHSTVSIATEKHIHPWRKYFDECYTDLPGVRKLHKFLIARGVGGKVLFCAGERCFDPHTLSAPLQKTNTSDADAAVVWESYSTWHKMLSSTGTGTDTDTGAIDNT